MDEQQPQSAEFEQLAAEAVNYEETSNADPEPESAPNIPTVEIVKPALSLVAHSMFRQYAPDEKSLEACAQSYAMLLDHYFPDGLSGAFMLWVNAIMLTYGTFGPSIQAIKQARYDAQQGAADDEKD